MKTDNSRLVAQSLQALFLAFLSIAIMVSIIAFNHLEVVRSNISLAISPLRYLVSLPATAGNWLGDWFTAHSELLAENEALKDESRILSARLQKLEILAEENARLRSLLGSSRKIADDVIVAELLSVDQNPYRQLIEINKGSSDGVEIGHAVIDDFGVMGQVIHVNPQSATTILISDPEHAIPVQFIRSGTRSVAFGRGSTRAARTALPAGDRRHHGRRRTGNLRARWPLPARLPGRQGHFDQRGPKCAVSSR